MSTNRPLTGQERKLSELVSFRMMNYIFFSFRINTQRGTRVSLNLFIH